MDETGATGALLSAANLAAVDPIALDGQSFAAQIAATRALFAAIGAFYKAANVRPQSDPLYALWWMDHFGSLVAPSVVAEGRAVTDDPAWARPNGVGTSVMTYGDARSTFGRAILDTWARLGKAPIDSDNPLCKIILRFELNETGDVIQLCPYGRGGGATGLCDFGVLFVGSVQDGATVEGDRNDWRTLLWNDPPPAPGRAGAWCRIAKALPPVEWFYTAAVDLVGRIAARTDPFATTVPQATAGSAIRYSLLWNLAIARRFGVLPADLAGEAANLPDVQQLAQVQAQTENVNTMRATLGTAAQASGNVYAQLFSAVMVALAGVLPAAVGVEADQFGRALPFLMTVDIDAPAPAAFRLGPGAQALGAATSRLPNVSPSALAQLATAAKYQLPQSAQQRETSAQGGPSPVVLLGLAALAVLASGKVKL